MTQPHEPRNNKDLPRYKSKDYTIAWICALPEPEWAASRFLFDTFHGDVLLPIRVSHQYAYGSMCGHNVVMGCLSPGQLGEASAAAVLSEMKTLFPLQFALMVGVGGGVCNNHDVRLGDVVVSYPNKDSRHGGVIQYNYGKAIQGQGLQLMGSLNMPDRGLLGAVGKVQSTPPGQSNFDLYLSSFEKYCDEDGKQLFARPTSADILFAPDYIHKKGEATCEHCDLKHKVHREPRKRTGAKVHYGLIASGDEVMKDAVKRDAIWRELKEEVLCFEMVAAGLANQLSCLVIRGICDYCDSHNNKSWQWYASSVAAAWAKNLLSNTAPLETNDMALVRMTSPTPASNSAIVPVSNQIVLSKLSVADNDKMYERISDYDPMKELDRFHQRRLKGTSVWIKDDLIFQQWCCPLEDNLKGRLLWLLGKVGSGKTFVMEFIVRHMLDLAKPGSRTPILHYFVTNSLCSALDILHSLAKQLLQWLDMTGQTRSIELAKTLLSCFGKDNRSADIYDLVEGILLPLINSSDETSICLDGLEQCQEQEHRKVQTSLDRFLNNGRVRILISSRTELWPSETNDNATSIQLVAGKCCADIEAVIEQRLQRLSLAGRILADSELRMLAKTELLAKADGMFLWVSLLLDLLERSETVKAVRTTLQQLPSDLGEIYLCCLRSRKQQRYICDLKMIRLVCAVAKPLGVDGLREMLAIDSSNGECDPTQELSTEGILRAGVGLIAFDEVDRVVVPIHQSVIQFVFSEGLQEAALHDTTWSKVCNFRPQTQRATVLEIAKISMAHIDFHTLGPMVQRRTIAAPQVGLLIPPPFRRTFGVGTRNSVRLPVVPRQCAASASHSHFLEYAIATWPSHTMALTSSDDVYSHFLKFVKEPARTRAVYPWSTFSLATETSHFRGLLAFAVAHNHLPLLRLLVEDATLLPPNLYDNVLAGNENLNAIHLVAKNGSLEAATLLMGRCNFNARCLEHGRTALHYAAEHGHAAVVNLFLDRSRSLSGNSRCDVNAVCKDYGRTALQYGVKGGYISTIQAILADEHLNAKMVDKAGHSPLFNAVSSGNEEVVECLLDSGWTWSEELSPLLLVAVELYQPLIARKLLSAGRVEFKVLSSGLAVDFFTQVLENAEIFMHNHAGDFDDFAHLLIRQGHFDSIIKSRRSSALFLKRCSQLRTGQTMAIAIINRFDFFSRPDALCEQVLTHAIGSDSRRLVAHILAHHNYARCLPERTCGALVRFALHSGHAEVLKIILTIIGHESEGVGSDSLLWTGLTGKSDETLRVFLAYGLSSTQLKSGIARALSMRLSYAHWQRLIDCMPEKHSVGYLKGDLPMLAAETEAVDLARVVLSCVTGVTGVTDINVCEYPGLRAMKSLLATEGIDIVAEKMSAESPLHLAIRSGHINEVVDCLERRIDVNVPNGRGETPLHLAIPYRGIDMIRLLLGERTINVNAKNDRGETPLHLAIVHRDIGLVRLLLDVKEIDINMENDRRETPLHLAIVHRDINLVRLLLARGGIDVNAKSGKGETPSSLATRHGKRALATLLWNAGGSYSNASSL